jgi:eukaryotic-like serine/threonine-protein kinase
MARRLRASSWPEARAALERAKGRLGERGPAELHHRLEQGARELELVAQLEAVRQEPAHDLVHAFISAEPAERYEEAFRSAGLGQVHDDPEVVAERVRTSDIRNVLVAALDHWSSCTAAAAEGPRRRAWVLDVARRADPDPTGWRDRARDPDLWADQAALAEVIRSAPVAEQSVPLLLTLSFQLKPDNTERLLFLKRIQLAHPDDFWANIAMGEMLEGRENNPAEAIRYYQAAVSLRPRTAFGYLKLGMALSSAGRLEEAAGQLRQAVAIDPTSLFSQYHLAIALAQLGRDEEAIDQLQKAIRSNPNTADLRAFLGHRLNVRGRHAEALTQYREAVVLDPKGQIAQGGLRATLVQMGRGEEARVTWQQALEANPPRFDDWYGYAELCLFLSQEGEYRRAREALLSRFGATTDPHVAEKTARACLLLPATGDELRQAVALAERAVAVEPSKYADFYPHFLFAQRLGEYRQGRLDRAVSAMRGDAARVLGPDPRLVLAMALHRSGQTAEARKALAAAVLAHDWSADQARFPSDWSSHVLRREAEAMILPNLPAFLDGKYQPQDNDERLALLGVCQFTNRTRTLARLYAEAFAAAPHLADDLGAGHRYNAARAAAQAGCGHGADATGRGEEERTRLREQARDWLQADLAAWAKTLDSGSQAACVVVKKTLTHWQTDPDLAGLREHGALDKLSTNERKECLALWNEVGAVLNRTEKTKWKEKGDAEAL